MPVISSRTLTSVVTLTILGCSQNSLGNPVTCTEKYTQYAQAQITWQKESAARAIQLLPDHTDRIQQYRDVQLTAIKRRKLAVHIALESYPDRAATWGSINQWIELSPEFETELALKSPDFKKLTEQHHEQTSKPASEGDNEFSLTFRKTVLSDPEFMQLMDDFNQNSRELNSLPCEK
ncbi:MAG: hypothetical protein ACRBB6_01985 [Neptuniibacter sp.]